MRALLVTWIDSKSGVTGWEYKDEIEPLLAVTCVSVGFLFEDHKDYITLIQSDSETQVLGRLTIPKVAIKKRKYLK